MSDNNTFGFAKLVPGFDFLQNLAKGASGSVGQLPNLSNWVAPTISVEDLEKRIEELKSVQFWLEQNSRALAATIQALEVQKMTLATLQGMNFSLGDVANAFKMKAADTVASSVQKASETVSSAAQAVSGTAARAVSGDALGAAQDAVQGAARKAAQAVEGAGGLIDPMQWWGALAGQFQEIATNALKDAARQSALDTTKNVATGLAKEALKTATDMAQQFTAQGVQNLHEAAGLAAAAAPAPKAAAKKAPPAAPPGAKTPAKAPAKTPAKRAAGKKAG